MITLFSTSLIIDGNCYVADYTDITAGRRGVEVSITPFEDITYFSLIKKGSGNIPYQAVNLEQYPAFIKGIDNCECVFNSLSNNGRPWLLFLETKYCHKAENIDNYPVKAYNQMAETLDKLISQGVIKENNRRIYFVYSVPPFPKYEPFGAFAITQSNMLQSLEQRGIILMGYNSMMIHTPQYLYAPKKDI